MLLLTVCHDVLVRAQTPTQVTATVLLEFVHRCSPDQRAALEALMKDPVTSSAVRTVAAALLRVIHRPHPDDLPALDRLSKDASVEAGTRVVASVVHDLIHVPTKAQRARLQRLLNEGRGPLSTAKRIRIYEHVDRKFAEAYWFWFFLSAPSAVPETFVEERPEFYMTSSLFGKRDVVGEAAFNNFVRTMIRQGAAHAQSEDYRAAATIDLEERPIATRN